jgi:hypothetical protein
MRAERAALYARVFSAWQEQEQTVASQVAALHQAAAQLGPQVPPQHCYVNEGFSGTRLDRPAFDAMRDAAADGLLDVVLVFAPDRLARNDVHQLVVLEELAARGVRVRFVERPIGDLKPANILRQPGKDLALVDFGLARDLVRGATHRSTLVGTFGYMPPEQLGGIRGIDTARRARRQFQNACGFRALASGT